MKTCPDCGSAVYSRGCVNCNEPAYIAEQEELTERYIAEQPRCLGCGSRGCTNPNCGPLENES